MKEPRRLEKRTHMVLVPSMCSTACHKYPVSLPRMPWEPASPPPEDPDQEEETAA